MSEHREEILIVGAGVAGLYCAWRLLKINPHTKIALLDLLDRTGGRLDTDVVHIRDLDGKLVEVKDEEGGMRFNTSMQELFQLLFDLDLCKDIVTFGMSTPNNRYCVRGHSFTFGEAAADNNAIWGKLYKLAPAEQSKSPGDIIAAVYAAILAENNRVAPANPTPEFWREFRLNFTYAGIPLYHWGLWSLLRAFGLTEECIDMLTDTVGFQGPFLSANVNAGEAYQILMDFPKDPRFFSLNKGFATLPDTLREKLVKMGAKIHLNTQATSVVREAHGFTVHARTHAGATAFHAHKVILALPAEAMAKLFGASPALNAEGDPVRLLENIGSVEGMRLCKVNFYYREAWWRDGLSGQPSVSYGGSFTSLPMGSAYVFAPINGEPEEGPAALTIYCDFNRTNFWEQLQSTGPKFTSPLQEEYNRAKPQVLFAASEAIVAEAANQLKALFKTLYVPRPVLTSFRLWSGDRQFGHAYHQWVRFADDRRVMDEIANPVPDVYVCNEAYSDSQGWVNGSLRSAEIILTRFFGLEALVPDPKTWTMPCSLPAVAPMGEQQPPRKLGGAWLR